MAKWRGVAGTVVGGSVVGWQRYSVTLCKCSIIEGRYCSIPSAPTVRRTGDQCFFGVLGNGSNCVDHFFVQVCDWHVPTGRIVDQLFGAILQGLHVRPDAGIDECLALRQRVGHQIPTSGSTIDRRGASTRASA